MAASSGSVAPDPPPDPPEPTRPDRRPDAGEHAGEHPGEPVHTPVESALRRDAGKIVDAALAAVDPGPLVRAALADEPLAAPERGRVVLLAVGKASPAMAAAAVEALPGRAVEGVVLAPAGGTGAAPPGLALHRGGHPLPDRAGVEGARAARELIRRAGPDDRVLLLLSGGGSALLALPVESVPLDDLRTTTDLLLRAGADITALNTVRKHLEVLKGGRLAREAAPAPVRALILSDVPGDRLDVIASGPVTPDASTFADAVDVLVAHGVWERTPASVRAYLRDGREGREAESPGEGDPCFAGVETRIVGSAATALEAAGRAARALGYRVDVGAADVTGEARTVGAALARRVKEAAPGTAVLQAGETTVTVTGRGVGGRNQEVALGAALELAGTDDALVFSVGTDGVDGPTDAAGGLATGSSVERAGSVGLDVADHLARNDSHTLLSALGDHVVTGPTGTNVMDLMGGLTARAGSEG